MTDPVMLSGGSQGGTEVEGAGWADGAVRLFGNEFYRRSGNQAVYVGPAG